MSRELPLAQSVVRLTDEGMLVERLAPGAKIRLADAEASVAAYAALTGGRRRPLLVDVRAVHAVERAARRLLSGPAAAKYCSAVALLVGSPLSRVVGNFFVGLNRPGVPVKLFSDEPSATTWLRAHLGAAP